ncbi:MAG TPA: hypothetical protein PKJ08_00265 [Candidatus Cloacimonadota bacterium]|nr:hypothetical protein [Candidatus Cloacimonadota bacterium]
MNNCFDRTRTYMFCGVCQNKYSYNQAIRDWFEYEKEELYEKNGMLHQIADMRFEQMKKAVEECDYKTVAEILKKNRYHQFSELYGLLSGDPDVPFRSDLIDDFFNKKKQLTIFDV